MKNFLFKLNVDDLYDSEKIFLWSIREWLLCVRVAKDPRKLLISPLSRCCIEEAVIPLDNIMRKLAYASSSPIDIRCHCSEKIGINEIDLLCILSIKQSKLEITSNKIIKYLAEEHLIELNNNCIKLIKYFNEGNLFFPIRKELISSYNIFNGSKTNRLYCDFENKTIH